MSALVYDLEIQNAIPPKNAGERRSDVQYCEGWGDHAGMGISVLCAYDTTADRYRVFCEDNAPEFAKLVAERDVVVTFNGKRFDNQVLGACWGIEVPETKHYDLLRELRRAQGMKPDGIGGGSLAAWCEANFGQGKSGEGAMAPIDWQRGNVGTVIDYCLMDTKLTTLLYRLASLRQPIKKPTGGTLMLRHPGEDLAEPAATMPATKTPSARELLGRDRKD